MTSRVARHATVASLGFVVQMLMAAALLLLGISPVLATLLAIEAAIVHNHAWHRCWAWRDRAAAKKWPLTLAQAHAGAGGTSLVAGALTVGLLSGRVTPLVAQLIAVALCASVNFWLTDRWIFRAGDRRVIRAAIDDVTVGVGRHTCRAAGAILGAVALMASPASASTPSPEALQSWARYVAALEAARTKDVTSGVPAWSTDDDPTGTRAAAALRRDELLVTRRTLPGVEVDGATLEHWQGSVLLRGVPIDAVLDRLRNPERYPQPPDVQALTVNARSDQGHELYLRLTRSMLVTATYDTWHQVRHRLVGPARVDSTSVATRIEEVHGAGTTAEQRRNVDEGRGFLWRMQSYWRFVTVPEGVIVTCESITLSRPVPLGLGLVARPIITRVARESMTTAVRAWKSGFDARAGARLPVPSTLRTGPPRD